MHRVLLNVWYQFDVAADGYSASWQSLLDWMVLSGINWLWLT